MTPQRFRAGRFVLDESRGDYYLGTNGVGGKLYRRKDGRYIYVSPSLSGKEVSDLEAKRWFYRCHKDVHNFRWLFSVCFHEDWTIEFLRKRRARRRLTR